MPDLYIAPESDDNSDNSDDQNGVSHAVGPDSGTSDTEQQPSAPPSPSVHLAKRNLESEGQSLHPLSAFAALPDRISFENRDPDEEVLLLLRQHPITNSGWVLIVISAFVVSLLVLNPPFFNNFFDLSVPPRLFLFAEITFYLLLVAYSFERFLFWYFNVFIITDRRLVDIDFSGLLSRQISDTPLYQVQDVTYNHTGISQSLFDYGDVLVQTAAEKNYVDFNSVPKPSRVADVISDLI